MNDMTPDRNERKANLKGLGSSRKRVEDARFTQGKGNYVDDIKLAGMLHGCLLYTSPSPRDATLSRMPSSA